MSKKSPMNRLLSVLLALAMVLSLTVPVLAEETGSLSLELVDNSEVSLNLTALKEAQIQKEEAPYADNEVVRVSIVLDKPGTIEAGYSALGIADNAAAMNYRSTLKREQKAIAADIQKAIGEELDIVWNLTLAANLISANVKYGQIAQIEAIPGIAAVVLETQYEPAVVSKGESPLDPNMAVSGGQVGAYNAWTAGYTGAGSKVAIIDTGLDLQHEAFAADAFEYSLSQLDGEYDLLTVEDIAAVLSELNVVSWRPGTTAAQLYANSKAPFAFSYIDEDLDVSHYNSEHGSHVAGISAANKYVKRGNEFAEALTATGVQGIAPDAQILVMQVFGNNGGAYDSDYMAAIEDAIVLGADSVNLSLGSAAPGMSKSATYEKIMESLVGCGVTVVMSAGNNGHWYDVAQNKVSYLYLDDVGTHTGGSPGTFTNSLGVASVDNHGEVAMSFTVGNHVIAVTESQYSNEPLATLAGEQEFVFIEGLGKPEDWAALGDAVKGKVAFCYRGETSFFEKANAAVEAGAIAVVVCNNQDGVIRMDLSSYSYTAPVVSITKANAELIKAAATKADGYYTGTMIIADGMGAMESDSEYYTMSDFSSWGIPGSLIMKPEIAAPGGSIYSVADLNPADNQGLTGHDKYELMSGTSMAAPQVTGMVAVMTQYLRENGLEAKTGLDARVLAQSLLMSTAVPMYSEDSDYYYPILQQGAGQANIGEAIAAASYILMNSDATASYADGKVKAELGDDPDRNGVYTFSFTINNLTDEAQIYNLSADVFTQGAGNGQGTFYMDRDTMALANTTTWKVNGEPLSAMDKSEMDFNDDGIVDDADGQMLLDYVSGKVNTMSHLEAADINGDGKITSYDAYLFFTLTQTSVTLPANGSVEVEVTIALAEDEKAILDRYYTGGAYIQAYVYAEAAADDEGAAGTTHSIPVLGFYGSWTDASMFDKGSVMEYMYDMESRAPYLLTSNYDNGNANTLYLSSNGETYYFGGNPVVADAYYMPERNALSVANGDYIAGVGYAAIRNAGAGATFVRNADTGEYLVLSSFGQITSAYYNANQGAWKNTWATRTMNYKAVGVAEGTALEVGIVAIPEYYTASGAAVKDIVDQLGEGAFFSMPMVIDNTAPGATSVKLTGDKKTMIVYAADNQYVAGVILVDSTGTTVEAMVGSNADVDAGEFSNFYLDVSQVVGEGFFLLVADYAGNVHTYQLDVQLGELVDRVDSVTVDPATAKVGKGSSVTLTANVLPRNASDRTVTWSSSDTAIATVSATGVVTGVAEGTATITATSNLDSSKSASCVVTVTKPGTTVKGILSDIDSNTFSFEWNVENSNTWTGTKWNGDYWFISAAQIPGTDTAYGIDYNTGSMNIINTATGTATAVGSVAAPMSDMDYSITSTGNQILVNAVFTSWLFPAQDVTNFSMRGFNLASYLSQYTGAQILLAVASAGSTVVNGVAGEKVYALDSAGYLWEVSIAGDGADINIYPTDLLAKGCDIGYVNAGSTVMSFSSMHVAENGDVYLSTLKFGGSSITTWYSEIYKLTPGAERFTATYIGRFADGVTPAIITDVQGGPVGANAMPEPIAAEIQVTATQTTVEELMNTTVTGGKSIRVNEINGGLNAVSSENADLLPLAANEDELVISVVPKNDEGEEISNTNGKFTVTYDSTQVSLVDVEMLNCDYYSINDDGQGTVTIAYVGPQEIPAGTAVAKLVFSTKNAAVDNEITVAHEEYNDAEYELVETYTVEGKGLLGDANGDGSVNPVDALTVLQYFVGMINADALNLALCDLDGNGSVNPVDALLILQYFVGMIDKFPVEN